MVSLDGLCLGLCTVVLFGGLVRWFVFGIIYGGFVRWFVFGITRFPNKIKINGFNIISIDYFQWL